MYKVAVLDDDEYWCLAIQRYFRKEFEVSIFLEVENFLNKASQFDLAIVDFSIPRAKFEPKISGSEIICHLKKTLENPPILVLASGFISQNDREAGQKLCPQADDFLAKDAGLDQILIQIKELMKVKNHHNNEPNHKK
ncbi:response regulator [Microcoleus sp. FACHB-672]|uniref:response regulator n=1 Tax=Microcoleus sp. FACHB-672 TaxID=2692825 RepID=UPI00168A1869|nr:response regulator [Microcoleus sp. FACHB-672]MBD2042189.1 response regulator [Microcoleus sp. FACHB-672]